MKYYRIKDWNKHYENNRTRELKKMDWVPVPNKHDGDGFLRIMEQPDGLEIYAAWHLILQVASKCETRGTLLRDSRTPLFADSIARKCSCRKPDVIQRALDFCSSAEVGWIECFTMEGEQIPHPPAEIPHPPAVKGMEGKGTEENEKIASPPAQPPPAKPPRRVKLADDSEWLAMVKAEYSKIGVDVDAEAVKARAWLLCPKAKGRKFTQQFFLNWLSKTDRNVAGSAGAMRSTLNNTWHSANPNQELRKAF
jgi:hypothetical protein